MRIDIPSNPDEFITLAQAILAQHNKLGVASPLNGIKGIAGFGAQVTAADTNNKLANSLYEQAKTATQARDNAIGPDTSTPGYLQFFVTSARDVLAGQNKGSEHVLGDWGYNVIASAAAKPAAKAAAKAKPAS